MSINLKQILITDTDNIKLDKVNYNFDQLVSNGGGPQGPQGSVGATGSIGNIGAQGYRGSQGIKGPVGIKGLDGGGNWNLVEGNLLVNSTLDVLYPLYDENTGGVRNIVLGYESSDDEYNTSNNTSVLTLHRKDYFSSNLRLLNLNSKDAFDWISDVVDDYTVVTAKFNTINSNKFINYAHTFIFKATNSNVLNLNKDNLNINVNSTFENDITIDGNLKITNTDSIDITNYVAVSNDDQGTLVFKDAGDLGGTAPIGTIVSILPSIFEDDNNFKKEETYTITDPDNELLKISVGAGIGEYDGWYICNGKTWTNGSDINYTTPDLNSFSYEIQDNLNSNVPHTSQGFVKVTNSDSNIIGGANIFMNADWNSSGYDISQTTEVENDYISNGNLNNSYTTFDIKRFPQIIYLRDVDLYWEDAGGDWAPQTTVTHTFTDLNPNNEYTSTEDFEDNSGNSGSFYKYINPPTDYYWNVNNLPTITPPDGYTIGLVELVPADTDPGLYNERLKITVNYDSHPNISKDIDFTFDSADHLILIPESTISLTVNESAVPDGTTEKPIEGSYTSIVPIESQNPILGFNENKYIIDAGQTITEDAYRDASIEIINTTTGDTSSIVATKSLFGDPNIDPNKIEWTFSIASGNWPAGGTTEEHEIVVEASNLLNDRVDFQVIANDITTIDIVIKADSIITNSYQPAVENTSVGTSTSESYGSWIRKNTNTLEILFSAYTSTPDQQIEYVISNNSGVLASQNGLATESDPITTTAIISNPTSNDINSIIIETLYYNTEVLEEPELPIENLTAIELYKHTTNVCENDIPSKSTYYINNVDFGNATSIYEDTDGDGDIYVDDKPDDGWFNDGSTSKLWSLENSEFTQTIECTEIDGGDNTTQLYDIILYEPPQGPGQNHCESITEVTNYAIDTPKWSDATKLYDKNKEPVELVDSDIILNNGAGGLFRKWAGYSYPRQFDSNVEGSCGGDGTGGEDGTSSTSNYPTRLSTNDIIYIHNEDANVNNDFDEPILNMPTLTGNDIEDGQYIPELPVTSDDTFMQGDIVNNSNKPIKVWPTLFSNVDMMNDADTFQILPDITIYYKIYELDGSPDTTLPDIGPNETPPTTLKVGWNHKNTLGSFGWDSITIQTGDPQRYSDSDGIWYRYATNSISNPKDGIPLNSSERVFIAGWTWSDRLEEVEPGVTTPGIFTEFDNELHLSGDGELSLGFTYKQTGDTAPGEWNEESLAASFHGSENLMDRHLPYPVVDFLNGEYPEQYSFNP